MEPAVVIGLAAVAALVVWLVRPGRARHAPAPEDDVDTPIDEAELAEAERELARDAGAEELSDDGDDDWGPGAGGRG